jgi:hypothetical protein
MIVVGMMLADGLGLVDETQPVVDARTNAPINNSGSAYFNGILMYRFIILTIGFMIQLLPRHVFSEW